MSNEAISQRIFLDADFLVSLVAARLVCVEFNNRLI